MRAHDSGALKLFFELQQSVTDISKRELAATSFFAGALLLLCALTFYYFTVLKIDYGKTTLLNLAPYPDATEYFAQAKTLLKDGRPSIQIGYDKLPSRYPFGYPALMLPCCLGSPFSFMFSSVIAWREVWQDFRFSPRLLPSFPARSFSHSE